MQKKIILLGLLCLFLNLSFAQFSLGEIAFSSYNADPSTGDLDEFTIVLIRGATIGERISFTDAGWFTTGGFRPGEDFFTLTFTKNYVPGSQIVCSRVPFRCKDILFSDAGTVAGTPLDLSFLGDQIFAYDPDNLPSLGDQTGFVAAIQMNGGWDGNAIDDATSAKPGAFSDGMTSISISPEVDNARINLPNCFGFTDQGSLLALCNDSSNWGETSNAVGYNALPPVCDFTTVLSDGELDALSQDIQIHPNPTSDLVNVEFAVNYSTTQLKVIDLIGKEIMEIDLNGNDNTFDVSDLSSGVYLLKFQNGNRSVVRRLIKK